MKHKRRTCAEEQLYKGEAEMGMSWMVGKVKTLFFVMK